MEGTGRILLAVVVIIVVITAGYNQYKEDRKEFIAMLIALLFCIIAMSTMLYIRYFW